MYFIRFSPKKSSSVIFLLLLFAIRRILSSFSMKSHTVTCTKNHQVSLLCNVRCKTSSLLRSISYVFLSSTFYVGYLRPFSIAFCIFNLHKNIEFLHCYITIFKVWCFLHQAFPNSQTVITCLTRCGNACLIRAGSSTFIPLIHTMGQVPLL